MNYTALDTSALSWLLPELKTGLSKARAELMREQDASPVAALQSAKSAVHEAAGALQIMDAKGLVQYAQALEGALGFLINHPDEATQDALDHLDDACNALIAYLEDIQGSTYLAQPVVLYAYYDDLHVLQGTPRYHAADLYFPPLSARFSLPAKASVISEDELKRLRRSFEHDLLPVLKDQANAQSYLGLQTVLGTVASAQTNAQTYTFWCCCQAVLETLVIQSEQAEWLSLDIKRWIARINLQLRRLTEGSPHIAERLYREALYFVAHHIAQQDSGTVLSASIAKVSETFKLAGSVPDNALVRPYRRLDEAKLSQAKHAVKTLKVLLDESVHHHQHGATDGVQRSSILFEQRFKQARQELGALVAHLKDLNLKEAGFLADALAQALALEAEKSPVLTPQMSVHAASSLLMIEQGMAQPSAATLALMRQRTQGLQAFAQSEGDLSVLEHGNASTALGLGGSAGSALDDSNLNEALTREIAGLLASIEKTLDDYFRNPSDAGALNLTTAPLAQLESSFGMIELPAAMSAVAHISTQIQSFIRHVGAVEVGLFTPLAEEFGRLSVLVDLFGKNPEQARKHFSYDATTQKLLEARMVDSGLEQEGGGRGADAPFESVEALAAQRLGESQVLLRAFAAQPEDASTKKALELALKALKDDAELIGDDALSIQASQQLFAVGHNDAAGAVAVSQTQWDAPIEFTTAAPQPSAESSVPTMVSDLATGAPLILTASAEDSGAKTSGVAEISFEQELLQTFLEEAQEVLDHLKPRLSALQAKPDDDACLSYIRRAFHTLKGSGRMVGLNALGDAAWVVEKRLNDLIANHEAAPVTLLHSLDWAHKHLQLWVSALHLEGRSDYEVALFQMHFQPQSVAEKTLPTAPKTLEMQDVLQDLNVLGVAVAPVTALPALQDKVATDRILVEQVAQPLNSELSATNNHNQESATHVNKPRISLVTDNSARLVQDFIGKKNESKTLDPRAVISDAVLIKPPPLPVASIKVIGPIKLPMPLYAIYIAESEDHIRQLQLDLQLWALQPSQGCSYEAYRFAHSLKGGAATVGFGTMRDVASSLEGVLDLSHKRKLALTVEQFALVESAVQLLQAMHTEFAEGRYPAGDYGLVLALADLSSILNATTPQASTATNLASADELIVTMQATQPEFDHAALSLHNLALAEIENHEPIASTEPFVNADTLEQTPAPLAGLPNDELDSFATMLGSFSMPKPASLGTQTQTQSVMTSVAAPLATVPTQVGVGVSTSAPELETDDPIADQLALLDDEIEPSILPDFIEEADELMPQCAQWMMDLEQRTSHAADLRRGLHTLKGGARMAGAMKLGAVLHMLESDVESLLLLTASHTLPQTSHLHLIALFDRAQHLYDVLVGRGLPKTVRSEIVPTPTSIPTQTPTPTPVASTDQNAAPSMPEPQRTQEARLDPASSGLNLGNEAVNSVPVLSAEALAPYPMTLAQPKPLTATTVLPAIRLRTETLDRLVNQAGEVTSNRARLDQHVVQLRGSLKDLTDNVERLRTQLREVEIQAESQMNTRLEQTRVSESQFDPLEFDRFTRFQELTRMLAESLSDMVSLRDNVAATLNLAEQDLSEQNKLTRDLTQSLMRTRLVQFDAVADRLYRVARQAARDLGKQVELDIQGGTVELDRSILERMTAPLEHMVRNCVAHGIEHPATRVSSGKSNTGRIIVSTRQVGNEIELTVQDDGAGLNLNKIREQAVAKGLLAADATPGHTQLAELVFLPGFSTASEVTQIAGRGVGMDVVRSEAAALGGRVNIEMLGFSKGQVSGQTGSKFIVRLPLTLAVNQVLLVRAADTVFAVPAALIESLTALPMPQLAAAYQSRHLEQRGHNYPFAYLGSLLELAPAAPESTQRSAQILLIHSGNERVAVHVDSVIGNQEVVVKNIGSMLSRIQGINSATVLGAGELCLIIDPGQLWLRHSGVHNAYLALADNASANAVHNQFGAKPLLQAPAAQRKLAMVVDDSLTVRKITQRLLIRENWQVVLAKDGVDALEQLQSLVPDVMLVDIEMPRMDGFDLTRNVRADERLAQVPIIMITSRTADKHRQYAVELGVNAYLGKPYHDDELLKKMTELTGF